MMQKQLTAIIEREGDGYVSFCPEFDIASQGDTIEAARKNLKEALELFFETASSAEILNSNRDRPTERMTLIQIPCMEKLNDIKRI